MSIKSWTKEYVAGISRARNKLTATEHSLNKWIGLREENLKRHNLEKCKGDSALMVIGDKLITEESHLEIDGNCCALCRLDNDDYFKCQTCPITKATFRACDDGAPVSKSSKTNLSPWHQWVRHDDPEPMILTLKVTRKYLQNKLK